MPGEAPGHCCHPDASAAAAPAGSLARHMPVSYRHLPPGH